jgi:hypothetical protein
VAGKRKKKGVVYSATRLILVKGWKVGKEDY